MRARRAASLRGRLVAVLLGASALVLTAAIGLSWRDARRELDALFDAQLVESARLLLMQAGHELHEVSEHGPTTPAPPLELPAGQRYAQSLHVQIHDDHGRLVYLSSEDAPHEALAAQAQDGFADRTLDGVRWRTLALRDPSSGSRVQLSQTYASRERLATRIARNMLLPFVVALPFLGLLIWVAAGRAVRPLSRLARELEERPPEDLAALQPGPVPRELEPVVGSLNGLLERLRERFELERRFTADAAHELRTPLAGLKTQAQVAGRARSEAEREHALAQIVRGVDRMTHLVQQLLTLARLDPDLSRAGQRPVDLSAAAREAVEELAATAIENGVVLSVESSGSAAVAGDHALLKTLARNLVDNAIQHGRAGQDVRARIEDDGAFVLLHVIDAGPGIPAGQRARVFDRFHRSPEARGPGSGLGLSIVQRIAELHGAAVSLQDGPGGRGLHVTVRFPAASDSMGAPSGAPRSRPLAGVGPGAADPRHALGSP